MVLTFLDIITLESAVQHLIALGLIRMTVSGIVRTVVIPLVGLVVLVKIPLPPPGFPIAVTVCPSSSEGRVTFSSL